jgi:hypothetical protein
MAWTSSNPVVVGNATKKTDYDTLWDNADFLLACLPWIIDIDVCGPAGSDVKWHFYGAPADYCFGEARTSEGGDITAQVTWPIIMGAGTWTFWCMYGEGINTGIISAYIDATLLGTKDTYSGEPIGNNNEWTITGIIISATGKKTLKLAMEAKHASSSDYIGMIQHVRLIRTA